MIPPRKTPLTEALLYRYVRGLARSTFHAIHVSGLDHLRHLPPDRPVLALANHSCWWDGFLIHLLTRAAPQRDFFCMMEEKQLRHFPFLTRIGAFSVNLESPRQVATSLRFTLRLLADPTKLVWLFPQGVMAPADAPLDLRPGAAFLLRKTPGALFLPVAFRYGFRREQKPEAWIRIHPPEPAPTHSDASITAALEAARHQLRLAWDQHPAPSDFIPLLPPRLSINKRWEWVKRACSGRWADFTSTN